MYEVRQHQREVNDRIITTFSRDIVSANMLNVEAGTNGWCGGDTGHGSRTFIALEDLSSTDIHFKPFKNAGNGGIEITLGGDCELDSIITALEFAVKVLREQRDRVHD